MEHDLSIERAALYTFQSQSFDLHPEDFYDPTHRTIFMAMQASLSDGVVDVSLAESRIKTNYDWLRLINDSLYMGAPHQLLRILRNCRANREAKGFKSVEHGDKIPAEFTQKGREIQDLIAMNDQNGDTLIEQIENGIPKMATGFSRFDFLCNGGIEHEGMLVIAAQEGTGKTALAVNLAANAVHRGESVCFVTLETSPAGIATRFLQAFWGETHAYIRQNIRDAKEPLDHFKVITPGHDIDQILGDMGMFLDCDLFIVDYFDLIGTSLRENQTTKLEHISHALKHFSFENKRPLVVLGQLSKELQKATSNREPVLGDLHGTSALSKDAHVVSFLWDKNAKDSTSDDANQLLSSQKKNQEKDLRWIIKKNRNGMQGVVHLDFDPAKMKFTEVQDSTFRT